MPDPKPGENRDDFLARCMGDDEAVADFPRRDQRFAFCNSTYRQAKTAARDKEVSKAMSVLDKFSEFLNNLTKARNYEEEDKAVTRLLNLPLASRDRQWDGPAAERRVRRWAGGPSKEDVDFSLYAGAFFWRDEENPELFESYKLGYADVIDGELTAIPRGIFAVAAALQGAREGVDISEGDAEQVKQEVSLWYKRMRKEFEDESIIAPWEEEAAMEKVSKNFMCDILKASEEKQLVTGVVLEPETVDLQGDIISAAEIEKTAFNFLAKSRQMGFRHTRPALAEVVESYLAPMTMTLNGQKVKKGSWVMTVKVNDELLWDAIKSGKIKSFSVGGRARRTEN